MRGHFDYETFSMVDLTKAGVYKYAEDPSTEILCVYWAVDNGPVHGWHPGKNNLAEFIAFLTNPQITLAAHNASFELTVTNGAAGRKLGLPMLSPSRFLCTAAKAAAHSLPRSLDGASSALGLRPKDGAGKRVMLKLSKPRKPTKDNPATRWTPATAPEDFQVLYAYCANDVEVEREIDNALPDLTPEEQAVWEFDYLINTRGLQVDLKAVHLVQSMSEAHKARLESVCETVSGFRPGQRDRVIEWCAAQGYPLKGYTALDIKRHLKDPKIPPQVKEVLYIRSETSRTSVKKYDALAKATCADQRLKGMFLYHGAGTGRWSGRIVQLHNLPRGKFKKMAEVAEQIHCGDIDWLEFLYGSPMDAFSTAIRPMLMAAPGKKLVVADFANIEGRVLAWLAGEEWKLDAFRAYDRKEGPDLYLVSAARIYNCTIEEAKPHRQIGKVAELALGFGGGVGAFQKMAGIYGVTLAPALESIKASATDEMISKAQWAWSSYKPGAEEEPMTEAEFMASDLVKHLWRSAHPKSVSFWYDLERAAAAAIQQGGVHRVGRVRLGVKGDFLYMELPSKRKLAYYKPAVTVTQTKWGPKESVTFMGEHPKTGHWCRLSTYGGSLCENAVQATARDFLVEGLTNVEAAGYPVIGHVHDEAISEVPEDFGSAHEYEAIMTRLPPWGAGCPVAAEGWEGLRYRK